MNREDVIRQIVERDLQNLPLWEHSVQRDAKDLHAAACKLFGVWETALKYAGVSACRLAVKDEYSRDRVLAKIRKICMNGNDMSAQRNSRRDRRLYEAARKHFGTWRRALKAAGINLKHVRPPSKPRRIDREKVIRQLRKRAESGRSMRYADVCMENRAFAITVKHAFRSWREGLVAAGLMSKENVVVGGRRWNPERVKAAIRKRAAEGKGMTYADVRLEDSPLISAARRYLGGWSESLVAAGDERRLP